MDKFIVFLLLVSMPNLALAEFTCKRGDGITKTTQGYLYTSKCHIQVGEVVQTANLQKKQVVELEAAVVDLKKAITLKDLAVKEHINRADMWQKTTFKLEDRINTMDRIKSYNKWVSFGFGVIVMGGAVYLSSKNRGN